MKWTMALGGLGKKRSLVGLSLLAVGALGVPLALSACGSANGGDEETTLVTSRDPVQLAYVRANESQL